MKKAIALLLAVLTIVSLFPTAFAVPAADVTFSVEADKSAVFLNEEIIFSVYIETAIPFTAFQFDVNAPNGVEYVANSGKIPEGLKAQMGFAEASFTEVTRRVTFGNDLPYSASGKLKVAEFKCKATAPSVAGYTISVNNIDVTDENFDSLTYNIVSTDIAITVPTAGVTLNKANLSLKSGESETLVAIVAPEAATNKTVSWVSTNPAVATVDNTGKVEAIKEGTTTITVTTEDGGFSASCMVAVECSHANKTETPASGADCVNSGNNKYYTCNACGDVFKADGVTETTVQAETLPALNHDFTEQIADTAHQVAGSGADCQHAKQYYFDCIRCNVMGTTSWTSTTMGNHQMETSWTTENNKHYHKCSVTGCTYIEDEENCSGGTATCTAKAVCSTCQKAYGEMLDHDLTHYVRNGADHTKPGNIEYWQCEDCDKYFSDASANNEITQADTVIEQIPHSHSTNWSKNDSQHWNECSCGDKINVYDHNYDNSCDTTCNTCGHIRPITHTWMTNLSYNATQHWTECSVCHEKKDVDNHHGGTADCQEKAVCDDCNQFYGSLTDHDFTAQNTDGKYLVSNATCVAKAVYKKSCTVCGTAGAETFEYGTVNANNHVGDTELRDDEPASCTEPGYSGDTWCKSCVTKIADGEAIPATAHKTATAVEERASTCKTNGVKAHFHCPVCNKDYLEKAVAAVAQTANDLKLPLDANNHEGGTEVRDAIPMTCTVTGYTGDTYCKGCDQKLTTGTDIPAEHKLEKVIANPATHVAAGNIEHYACSVCEKLFDDDKASKELTAAEVVIAKGEHSYSETFKSDENGHWKGCECGSKIEEGAHIYGEWVTTKKADVGVEGSKERTCSVCGYKQTEKLPATATPATGDDTHIGLLFAMMLISACGMIALLFMVPQKKGKYQR